MMARPKMQPMYQAEGVALAALRAAKGVKQETVGDAVEVSKSAVSEWERGISPPRPENLRKLDRYFGGSGEVLRIYKMAPAGTTNDELLTILEEVRGIVQQTDVVLRLLAERQGVALPTPSPAVSDPPARPAGRHKGARP